MFFLILRLMAGCFIYYWGIRGIKWLFKKKNESYYKRNGHEDSADILPKIELIMCWSAVVFGFMIIDAGTYFSVF